MAIFCPESENSMFGAHLDALGSFLTQHNIPPKNEVEVQKSHFSGEKIQKKCLFILFVPKPPKTHFRHNLLLILLYKSIRTDKTGLFLVFKAIFGDFCFEPNLGSNICLNCHFLP